MNIYSLPQIINNNAVENSRPLFFKFFQEMIKMPQFFLVCTASRYKFHIGCILAYIVIIIGSISVRIGYVKANTKPQWLKTTKVYSLHPIHVNQPTRNLSMISTYERFGAPTISNVGKHRGMVSYLQNNIPVQNVIIHHTSKLKQAEKLVINCI